MSAAEAAPLAGRRALVTGASKGIGLAIATALAGAGASVVTMSRSGLSTPLAGEGHVDLVLDLTDAGAVDEAVARLSGKRTGVSILVNNAGTYRPAGIDELSATELEETLSINLVAPYRLVHSLAKSMRATGTGHIVTIGSNVDRTVYPQNAAYTSSKYGLRVLHETMRAELSGTGVRCTLVSPRAVDTPLWDPLDPDNREGFIPRSRMLTAGEVAAAVVWALTQPPNVNIDELRLSPA